MKTGSVMAGSAVSGEFVCGPGPGMSKIIVSAEVNNWLASRIACRKEPGPASLVFVTMNVCPGTRLVAVIHGPSSDVFPNGSVAVAQTNLPTAPVGTVTSMVALPLASVVTVVDPRYC